jgi:hypothetical protein
MNKPLYHGRPATGWYAASRITMVPPGREVDQLTGPGRAWPTSGRRAAAHRELAGMAPTAARLAGVAAIATVEPETRMVPLATLTPAERGDRRGQRPPRGPRGLRHRGYAADSRTGLRGQVQR